MPTEQKPAAPVAPATGHTTISIDMAALEKLVAAGQTPPAISFLLRSPSAHAGGA